MVTAAQIRAARGLLGLSQGWLAKLAGISPTALVNIETGTGDPKASTMAKIVAALEKEGVEFIDGPAEGVKRRLASVQPLGPNRGSDGIPTSVGPMRKPSKPKAAAAVAMIDTYGATKATLPADWDARLKLISGDKLSGTGTVSKGGRPLC